MRKKQVDKVEEVTVSHSDKSKDKEWLALYTEKRKQGIIITFKPSRYLRSDELNRLERERLNEIVPPGYKDNNTALPQDKEK